MKSLHVVRKTSRPGLPLLLVSGLLFWVGTLIGITFGFELAFNEAIFVLVVLLVGSIVSASIFVIIKKGWTFYIVSLCLGALCAFGYIINTLVDRSVDTEFLSGTYLVYLEEDARHTEFSHTVLGRTTLANNQSVTVRLYIPDDASLHFGDMIETYTTLRLPSESSLQSCNRQGAAFIATVSSYHLVDQISPLSFLGDMRKDLLETIIPTSLQEIFEDGAILVRAIIFGDRSALLTSDIYGVMQKAGLAHLVAVSGAHLAIVSALIAVCLQKVPLSRTIKLIIQISALFIYLILVGFPLSCLRAAVMASLSFASVWARRRSSALSALGVVIIFFIALDPSCSASISFSLSCLATLGILVFVPLLKPWIASLGTRNGRTCLPEMIIDSIAMTLAATLLTIPISTATFSQFPLIAPISNVVATPILTLLCGLGIVSAFVSWIPLLGQIMGFCMAGIAEAFAFLARGLQAIPYSCIPSDGNSMIVGFLIVLMCIFLWVLWPKPPVMNTLVSAIGVLVLVAITFSVVVYQPKSQIIMLDVGQGDAIVIKSEHHSVLIDTGNQTTRLKKALARNGLTHFDAVVITHADDDHCGSLDELGSLVSIDTIFLANGVARVDSASAVKLIQDARKAAKHTVYISKGDRIAFDGFALTVLSPDEFIDAGGNKDSVCLSLTCDVDEDDIVDWTGLFTGDAESEIIDCILRENPSLTSDVLKIAHHGSKAAVTEDILEKLEPKLALISVGEHNRYGHPHQTILDLLSSKDIWTGRTDQQGDVIVTFSKESLMVDTQR